MGIKVICTIHPRKGKEDRAWELQKWLASQVKEKEPSVTSYKYGRGDGTYGGKDIVVVMEIDGQQNFEGRRDLEHHQEIARLIKEEDFLREPLKYFVLNEEAGW